MELTIAIWEDCKRLLTDNQSITCRRLQPFADIKVHVEEAIERAKALDKNPADRWPQTLGTRVYLLAESVMNRKQ